MLQPSRASPPAAPKAAAGTVGLTQEQLRALLQHVSSQRSAGGQAVDVDSLIAQICNGDGDLRSVLAGAGELPASVLPFCCPHLGPCTSTAAQCKLGMLCWTLPASARSERWSAVQMRRHPCQAPKRPRCHRQRHRKVPCWPPGLLPGRHQRRQLPPSHLPSPHRHACLPLGAVPHGAADLQRAHLHVRVMGCAPACAQRRSTLASAAGAFRQQASQRQAAVRSKPLCCRRPRCPQGSLCRASTPVACVRRLTKRNPRPSQLLAQVLRCHSMQGFWCPRKLQPDVCLNTHAPALGVASSHCCYPGTGLAACTGVCAHAGVSVAEAAARAAAARAERASAAVQALDMRRAAPFMDNLQVRAPCAEAVLHACNAQQVHRRLGIAASALDQLAAARGWVGHGCTARCLGADSQLLQRDIAAGLKALRPVAGAARGGKEDENALEAKLREGIEKFRFDDTATIGFAQQQGPPSFTP